MNKCMSIPFHHSFSVAFMTSHARFPPRSSPASGLSRTHYSLSPPSLPSSTSRRPASTSTSTSTSTFCVSPDSAACAAMRTFIALCIFAPSRTTSMSPTPLPSVHPAETVSCWIHVHIHTRGVSVSGAGTASNTHSAVATLHLI
ncbi:hypothetical protein FIBSPDRAFT_358453 [Athelia psychrophila]|uniref:Uncharacterized protein n=1 Tax=Athelia psychrophila TaxID=1759441 RepID=A0A166PK07_9AGAM|nr:hypothetical protein FIBSPDRAFT_358453 [Fibularhizoctonia sp. CBS 109695]